MRNLSESTTELATRGECSHSFHVPRGFNLLLQVQSLTEVIQEAYDAKMLGVVPMEVD